MWSCTNVPLGEEGIKREVRGFGGMQRAHASFLSQSFLMFFPFSLHVSLSSSATVQLTRFCDNRSISLSRWDLGKMDVAVCLSVYSMETYNNYTVGLNVMSSSSVFTFLYT